MKLFCATTNPGKLREFQTIAAQFGSDFLVDVLPGLRALAPCEETGTTFRENAIQKALYYSAHAPGRLFADDSGLAVDALDGAPGVYSARFAGPGAGDQANNNLLLQRMKGIAGRRARFVCVAALAIDSKLVATFEGVVEGQLLDAPRGNGGFGYDPLFYYPPFNCTLAEIPEDRKNEVSHRGKALRQMFDYLRRLSPEKIKKKPNR